MMPPIPSSPVFEERILDHFLANNNNSYDDGEIILDTKGRCLLKLSTVMEWSWSVSSILST